MLTDENGEMVYESKNEESNIPIRTKILSFIAEKGTVSKKELMEYFSVLKEEVGKKPSWSWLRKNSALIDSELDENGDTTFSLTKRGKRVLEVCKNFETLTNTYINSQKTKDVEIEKAKELLKKAGITKLDEGEEPVVEEEIK